MPSVVGRPAPACRNQTNGEESVIAQANMAGVAVNALRRSTVPKYGMAMTWPTATGNGTPVSACATR